MTTALTVDENANWRLYASHLPAGAVSRGTVQRPDGQTRALVRLASGSMSREAALTVPGAFDKNPHKTAMER